MGTTVGVGEQSLGEGKVGGRYHVLEGLCIFNSYLWNEDINKSRQNSSDPHVFNTQPHLYQYIANFVSCRLGPSPTPHSLQDYFKADPRHHIILQLSIVQYISEKVRTLFKKQLQDHYT